MDVYFLQFRRLLLVAKVNYWEHNSTNYLRLNYLDNRAIKQHPLAHSHLIIAAAAHAGLPLIRNVCLLWWQRADYFLCLCPSPPLLPAAVNSHSAGGQHSPLKSFKRNSSGAFLKGPHWNNPHGKTAKRMRVITRQRGGRGEVSPPPITTIIRRVYLN